MSRERLEEIKKVWMGTGHGLAVTGNAPYKMVAELIEEVENHMPGIEVSVHGEERSLANPTRIISNVGV